MVRKRRTGLSTAEKTISSRVLTLLEKLRIKRKPFAEEIGLDKGNFYRILQGKRGWTFDNLEKVAAGLGVTVRELVAEIPTVPLFAIIKPGGFDYGRIERKEVMGYVPYFQKEDGEMIEKIYSLKIDRGFREPFSDGQIIYIQKGFTPTEFKENDYVIYCREPGNGVLGQLSFLETGQVLLKSLSLEQKDLILHKDHLKLCDKVISLKFS